MTRSHTPPQLAVMRHRAFAGRVTVPTDPHACWTWSAGRAREGYGRVRYAGKVWWAHRLARFIAFGDQPEAVCHHCDNPPCVNPEHLRAGTLADNCTEMWVKGRARAPWANGRVTDLPTLMAALYAVGHSRGRQERLDALASRYGVSRRTLYRLLNPAQTPSIYRGALAATSQEKAA